MNLVSCVRVLEELAGQNFDKTVDEPFKRIVSEVAEANWKRKIRADVAITRTREILDSFYNWRLSVNPDPISSVPSS